MIIGNPARRLSTCSVGLALALSAGAAAHAEGEVQARLEKDQRELLELIQGRWVNELQVFFAEEAGLTETQTPERSEWVIEADPDVEAGVTVSDGSGARLATLAFAPDVDAGVVRADLSVLDDGCSLAWRREAGGFHGRAEGDCGVDGPSALILATNNLRAEYPAGAPAKEMERARDFSCWVSVLRGAEHGDAGAGASGEDWYFERGVMLHDQGGLATVTTDETPPRKVDLRLRRAVWPSGTNRPSMALYVHQNQDARATSYAWGSYDETRIGINLRWLQASCTHTPE